MRMIKKISAMLCMMLLVGGSAVALEKLKMVSLAVPTMNCAMCPITVSKSLMNIPGVQIVDAQLEEGIVQVSFNDQVTGIDAMTYATKMAGYPSYLIKE